MHFQLNSHSSRFEPAASPSGLLNSDWVIKKLNSIFVTTQHLCTTDLKKINLSSRPQGEISSQALHRARHLGLEVNRVPGAPGMRFLPSVEMTEWIKVKPYPATGWVLSSYKNSEFRMNSSLFSPLPSALSCLPFHIDYLKVSKRDKKRRIVPLLLKILPKNSRANPLNKKL